MLLSARLSSLAPDPGYAEGQNEQDLKLGAARLPSLAFSLPLAIVVGLLLRVFLIGSKSLWLDEAVSLHAAQAPLAEWLSGAADFVHPPLYNYGFLQHWMRLGQSEGMLRLSSAMFGVLAIPLVYALARRLTSKGISLSAAWLVALSPLLVWYSQELRSYSLLVSMALLSSLACVRLLVSPRIGWWLVYVAASAASLYTHYYALLMLPVQFALFLALLAQHRVRGATVVVVLAAWPVIAAAFWPWLKTPAAANFFVFARNSVASAGARLTARTGGSFPTMALLAILATAAGTALLLVAWLFVRKRDLWPAIYHSRFARASLLIAFVLFLVVSVWPRVYTLKQVAVIGVPFACLAVAWFWPLDERPSKPLLALLLLSAVASLVNVVAIPKEQWRETVQHISAVYEPGDQIWIAPGYENLTFDHYNRGRLPVTEINGPQDANSERVPAHGGRLWLVYNYVSGSLIGAELERQLAGEFRLADEWSAYRVRAVLFVSD